MLRIIVSLCFCIATALSFTTTTPIRPAVSIIQPTLFASNDLQNDDQREDLYYSTSTSSSDPGALSSWPSVTAAVVVSMIPDIASAAGPDWGIFEGRTLSLLHPAVMFSLLAYSIATAILGFQWRRQRTIPDEISELKAQLPQDPEAETTELESQIAALQTERKELANANPRDKHFRQGSWLVLIGTAFAIEGPLNTYARAGKLFPGPHLYAGAGLVVLWALAAACVPAMQKGDNTARYVHIAANGLAIGMFAWQVVSGVPILFKVIEFTKWP